MDIQRARYQHQRGSSVVELAIAAAIGGLMLVAISHHFLATQKGVFQLTYKAALEVELYQVLFTLKRELRRAGYNPSMLGSLKLAGATQVVESSDEWLDFATTLPSGAIYKTRYQKDTSDSSFDICVHNSATSGTTPSLGACPGYFFSLIDRTQMKVSDFDVAQHQISGQRSSLISVVLQLETNDAAHQVTQAVVVKQRNWL